MSVHRINAQSKPPSTVIAQNAELGYLLSSTDRIKNETSSTLLTTMDPLGWIHCSPKLPLHGTSSRVLQNAAVGNSRGTLSFPAAGYSLNSARGGNRLRVTWGKFIRTIFLSSITWRESFSVLLRPACPKIIMLQRPSALQCPSNALLK